MNDNYPNPWCFDNTDKILLSSDNSSKIVYKDLVEIAMGAPLGGKCFLETDNGKKYKIYDWCGGPAVWETSGHLLAIPIWTREFFSGTIQQIAVVNINLKNITIFKKKFRVLDFRTFDKNIIYGYDSPIFDTSTIEFDIRTEKIDKILKLI